jgi:antitoxin component YwqK of YwqJK toxin-antitoxin module
MKQTAFLLGCWYLFTIFKRLKSQLMTHIFRSLLFFTVCCIVACHPKDSATQEEKTIYYPGSSQIKQKVQYRDGKKNGYLTEYFRDGKLKTRQCYVNDSLTDTTFLYHPSGRLKTRQVYRNKARHGQWLNFNPEGKLILEKFYKNGMSDSTESSYSYRNNRLIKRSRFEEGALHGMKEEFYLSGKPKSRQYYHKGSLSGSAEEWLENGQPVNNDFNITVKEQNTVQLDNKLSYRISIGNPGPEDKAYLVLQPDSGYVFGNIYPIERKGDDFIYSFDIAKGGFVMEEVVVAVFKKTAMGNTVIKTKRFHASANHY